MDKYEELVARSRRLLDAFSALATANNAKADELGQPGRKILGRGVIFNPKSGSVFLPVVGWETDQTLYELHLAVGETQIRQIWGKTIDESRVFDLDAALEDIAGW